MAATIKLRRDLAANWTSADPTLASGEVGVETDTNKLKIGTGIAAWTALPYFADAASLSSDIVDALEGANAPDSGNVFATIDDLPSGAVWGSITGTLSSQTDLQSALNLKANLASPTFTGTVVLPTPFTLGATSVTATGTELNYSVGVTSAIQTQLNAKQASITTGTTAQYFRGDLSLATFPTNISSFTNDAGYLTAGTAASTYQPLDSDLTTIAGLTATTDNFMVSVSNAWASRTPSQVRTTLGLVIGTNVQAYDADLDTWAAVTPGTGVAAALAVNIGTAGSFVVNGGALGTPSSGIATNLTGTASGLTAGSVTTNANLTGPITSIGNATTIADPELAALAGLTSAADSLPYFTGSGTASLTTLSSFARTFLDDANAAAVRTTIGAGTGSGDALVANPLSQFASTTSAQLLGVISNETGTGVLVFNDTPTLIAPLLGTPTSGILTNATGLPINTGVSGLGTGVATALAVNVGSAGAFITFNGALGTPSSGAADNLTSNTEAVNNSSTQIATTAFVMQNNDYYKNIVNAIGTSTLGETIWKSHTITGNGTMADNTAKFSAIWIPVATTITGVRWAQGVTGNYTADQENSIALYTYSGGTLTQVATTGNVAALWAGTANTMGQQAFTSTYSAAAGLYYIGCLYNNSAQVTAPTIGASTTMTVLYMASIGLSNSAKLSGSLAAQNTLPSSQALSGVAGFVQTWWFSVY